MRHDFIFSKCYGILHAGNNKLWKNLYLHSLMHYVLIIQDNTDSLIVVVHKWKKRKRGGGGGNDTLRRYVKLVFLSIIFSLK